MFQSYYYISLLVSFVHLSVSFDLKSFNIFAYSFNLSR